MRSLLGGTNLGDSAWRVYELQYGHARALMHCADLPVFRSGRDSALARMIELASVGFRIEPHDRRELRRRHAVAGGEVRKWPADLEKRWWGSREWGCPVRRHRALMRSRAACAYRRRSHPRVRFGPKRPVFTPENKSGCAKSGHCTDRSRHPRDTECRNFCGQLACALSHRIRSDAGVSFTVAHSGARLA
jgi:hypothetical protein